MKTVVFILYLIGSLSATKLQFTDQERLEAVLQAVQDVSGSNLLKFENRIRRSANEVDKDSAAEKLSRHFRAASPESLKQGKARIFMEEAVRKAEGTLLNSKPKLADSEEMSLLPGMLLNKRELALIQEKSECSTAKQEATCPEKSEYRTIDGSCNNIGNSLQGASFTAFKRILPAHYEDGLSQVRGLLQSRSKEDFPNGPFSPPTPNVRLVSSSIMEDRPVDDSSLTHLHMTWGQFIDHDFDLAVQPSNVECDLVSCESDGLCAPIQVPTDDQTFGIGTAKNGSCLPFVRSLPACTTGVFEARNPINEITSYHDASLVYGNTKSRADFLREFSGGRLRERSDPPRKPSLPTIPPCPPAEDGTVPDECCPKGQEFCFVAGDKRVNEVVSLIIIHTLWLREHNRIAGALAELNPSWDDEKLYQEARKIVWAEMQKITYYEYIPTIFGPKFSAQLMGEYRGYDPKVDARISNAFATAAFRFGHSQIQDTLHRLDSNYNSVPEGHLSMVDAFFNPEQYNASGGTDSITRGMAAQPARATDEFLSSSVSDRLFETDGIGMDLASVNTMRGRDHGLPPYWVWKQFCKNRFGVESDFKNELTRIRLLQTYGNKESIDLWVGGLAEKHLEGAVVGATFACIMAIDFESLRCGDRFYFERPGIFPSAHLAEIMKTSMARIICDNSDNITSIQLNPFEVSDHRLPCSEIPLPNLQAWNENFTNTCYLKFQMNPITKPLGVFIRNRYVNAAEMLSKEKYTYPASIANQTQCTEIKCPTLSFSLEVVVQPVKRDLRNKCECTSNALLPVSTVRASGTYRATLDVDTLAQSPSNGIYTSKEECIIGTDSAAIFDCPE